MNINRHNYEEFFVLYADGELDAEGRRSVEAFTALHPDLADELQLLMDLRLDAADAPMMANKQALIRHIEIDVEQLSDMEKNLLSHLDGELDAASLEQLEAAIGNDPLLQAEHELLQQARLQPSPMAMPQAWRMIHLAEWNADKLNALQQALAEAVDDEQKAAALQASLSTPELLKEWHVLQQTRLQAEAVEMPNKQKLYRHSTPVVGIGWRKTVLRVVAAAAVIAGAGWFLFNQPDTVQLDTNSEQVALLDEPKTATPAPATVTPEASEPATSVELPAATTADNSATAPRQSQQTQPATTSTVKQPVQQTQPAETLLAANNNPDAQVEELGRLIAANRLSPEDEQKLRNLAQAEEPEENKLMRTQTKVASLAAFDQNKEEQPMAQYAVVNETEEFVTIAGAKIPKQKLRGVFRTVSRKVTRSFERNDVQDIAANLK